MEPLFKVGEEVILCSKRMPEYNGDYIVFEVIEDGVSHKCRLTGTIIRTHKTGACGYKLNIPISCEGGFDIVWAEIALRKKHKPADESFSEMINSLKRETA